MKSQVPLLGGDVVIDVDRLLVSRLLVQANSGGGKSYALRRLLEQTFGHCQHIVLDPEGEFHTLRERYDYVLVGKGGEAAASVATAATLAVRLLELGTSAIVDISELGVERVAFVTRFIEALMSAPRELWHSVLVVVDEAHRYCPQGVTPRRPSQRDDHDLLTEADSAAAVVSLMDSGRKRGFCGVLATQRISKLSKDASAECNNKLIGRCVEIDAKRAGDELGLAGKAAIEQLRKLRAGQFFAFGPALSDEVRLVQIGPVVTTHPEAGKAAPPPTPTPAKVREVLGDLAGLAAEAETEGREVEQLRARVAELEQQLEDGPIARVEQVVEERTVEIAVATPVLTGGELENLKRLVNDADVLQSSLNETMEAVGVALVDIKAAIELNGVPDFAGRVCAAPPAPVRGVHRQDVPTQAERRQAARDAHAADGKVSIMAGKHIVRGSLPKGEEVTLRALIQYASGLRREQLTVLTGYKRSSRDSYIQRLREKGLVDVSGDRVVVTKLGVKAMPDAAPLPTGRALQEHWLRELPEGERVVLEVLLQHRGREVDREVIDKATGYQRSSRDSYLQRLGAKELVINVGRGLVKASPNLFEVK